MAPRVASKISNIIDMKSRARSRIALCAVLCVLIAAITSASAKESAAGAQDAGGKPKLASGFWHTAQGFYHAVDWREPFFTYLLGFHVTVALLAVATRRSFGAQVSLMLFIAIAVLSAERVNSVLRQHFRSFTKQNYFDKHGVFMSVVFSVPLLIVLGFQLFSALFGASTLLVKVKRAEFAQGQKKKKKKQ